MQALLAYSYADVVHLLCLCEIGVRCVLQLSAQTSLLRFLVDYLLYNFCGFTVDFDGFAANLLYIFSIVNVLTTRMPLLCPTVTQMLLISVDLTVITIRLSVINLCY